MAKTAGKMGPAMAAIFTRYELYAGAAGFSPAHIDDMRNSVRYFDQFLGVIRDPAAVTPDDFRRYLVYLPTKPVWKGLKNEQARLLRPHRRGENSQEAKNPAENLFGAGFGCGYQGRGDKCAR
jgi:hypothetical protein